MTNKIIKIIRNSQNKRHKNHVKAGKSLKEKYINQGKQEVIDKIKKLNNVSCVGMSKEFIKGSNWCNGLWKRRLAELIKSLGGKNDKTKNNK